MREVHRSLKREARVWGVALLIVLVYLAGGYGAECWPDLPDLRHWFSTPLGEAR